MLKMPLNPNHPSIRPALSIEFTECCRPLMSAGVWVHTTPCVVNDRCFSAVFTWSNLLVAVVELDSSENEAADVIPLVTSAVLEDQYQVVGVVVVVDPGIVPINSRGEKQRMHLRDGFLGDQLDPIFVAYNMWSFYWVALLRVMWIIEWMSLVRFRTTTG